MPQRPDDPVTLLNAINEFEAGIIVDALAEAGIAAKALSMMAGDAYASPTTGGRVPVMVRRDQLEAAKAAVEQRRSDSVDIDWAEVDVGDPVEGGMLSGGRAKSLFMGAALVVLVLFVFWLFGFFHGGPPQPPASPMP